MMRPGDRKERWCRGHVGNAGIFACLAAFVFFGTKGLGGLLIVAPLLVLAALELRDAKHGWPMRDGPSPWVRRMMNRDDV